MTTTWLSSILLALLSLPLTHLGAENVEVLFTSGERAYGELISENDSELVIDRKVHTRTRLISGQASYPRRTVASVTPVPSLLDLYSALDKATPDTYADQFSFAKWCFERGLQDQAFLHAKRLYDEDPSDQVSQELLKELGYVQDSGSWVKEGEFANKHGLVNFDGRWLTPAQVELRKAEVKASYDLAAGIERQQTLENTVANDQRRIKEDQARIALVNKSITDIKQQNQANNQPAQRGQRNQQAQQQQPDPVDDTDAQAQKKELQKALDSATKQLATDQAAVEANKPEVVKLQTASTAAHQAFIDTLPKDAHDAASAPGASGAKPAPPTKPAPASPAAPAPGVKDAGSDR